MWIRRINIPKQTESQNNQSKLCEYDESILQNKPKVRTISLNYVNTTNQYFKTNRNSCSNNELLLETGEPGLRSWYTDWLWAGRPRGWSSGPGVGKNLHFSVSSRQAPGPTQPLIQWVPGALSLRVNRQRREADHSPPSSVEVKKMWTYTSTPPYVFMALCLIS
jgi:hypothetical protein